MDAAKSHDVHSLGGGEPSCAMVKSRYIGDGHPTFNRNPYNGYINPYYWVDDHPLLYGNNGSLDPGTVEFDEFCRFRLELLLFGASPHAQLIGEDGAIEDGSAESLIKPTGKPKREDSGYMGVHTDLFQMP